MLRCLSRVPTHPPPQSGALHLAPRSFPTVPGQVHFALAPNTTTSTPSPVNPHP